MKSHSGRIFHQHVKRSRSYLKKMNIHEIFKKNATVINIHASVDAFNKQMKQAGHGRIPKEPLEALRMLTVRDFELSKRTIHNYQTFKTDLVIVETIDEIEALVAVPKEGSGFTCAVISTDHGPFLPAMLEALRWDPGVIIIDSKNFPPEEQKIVDQAAMTGNAVYLVQTT